MLCLSIMSSKVIRMKHSKKTQRSLIVQSYLPDAAETSRIMEGYGDRPMSDVVESVRDGLLFAEFEALAELLQMPEDALAAALNIPRATLHRRKKMGQLAKDESERVVRFARVFGEAVNLFGTAEAAREWLREPAIAFGDQTPLAYMDTEVGARRVEELLGKIAHGVFA